MRDELQKPGYYWLAAEWTNLLPSCTHCNQNRRQRVHASDEIVTIGKMNQFPIANPSERATRPGDEAHERRLLLNPCRDHPEKWLVFGTEGEVKPATWSNGRPKRKARESIRVYALNRNGLCEERRKRRKRVADAIAMLADLLDFFDGTITSETRPLFERAIQQLKGLTGPDANYAGMARQMVADFLKKNGLRKAFGKVLLW